MVPSYFFGFVHCTNNYNLVFRLICFAYNFICLLIHDNEIIVEVNNKINFIINDLIKFVSNRDK